MEYKTFSSFATKAEDTGIVEAIVATMGNVDLGDDVIHSHAFDGTQVSQVKVLDAHKTDSVLRVVGKPLAIREVGRDELPQDLLSRYPDVTGGLWTRTQYLMDTLEGKGTWQRIRSGAINSYSIGYNPVVFDYSTKSGRRVRNLKKLALLEYSPVLWAMNPATATLSAKDDDEFLRLLRETLATEREVMRVLALREIELEQAKMRRLGL